MKGFTASLHCCELDLKRQNIFQCFIFKFPFSILGRKEFSHMGYKIRRKSMKINSGGCQVRMRGKMTQLQWISVFMVLIFKNNKKKRPVE